MAVVQTSVALDLVNPNDWYGDLIAITPTKITFGHDGALGVHSGYGISSSNGVITGGTLTSYAAYAHGVLKYAVYGGDVDAAWAYQQVISGNFGGIVAEALKGDDRIVGSAMDDKLAGYDGNDTIFGGLGNDTIYGGAGNDFIDPGLGKNLIDGGSGVDTVAFAANRDSYQFNRNASNVTVSHNRGDSFDTIINVERFQFSDGTLAFDADGNAGKAFRLYQAAFDREPDLPGLGFWVRQLDDGASLNNVSARFIDSDEFGDLYGRNLSNEQFVTKLYLNILDRDSDASGKAFWVGELNSGHRTREQVLSDFSESDENVIGVAPSISDGIWYI